MIKHIVSLSMTSSKDNFETIVEYQGKPIRLSHYGADFDPSVLYSLLKRFDGECDCIAISGIHPPITIGLKTFYHPDAQRLLVAVKHTRVTDGFAFRKTFIPWAVKGVFAPDNKSLFPGTKVAFLTGLAQQELVSAIADRSERLYFADPYFHFGAPIVLHGVDSLLSYAKTAVSIFKRVRYKPKKQRDIDLHIKMPGPNVAAFNDADLFVTTATLLDRCDLKGLKGKIVLVDGISPAQKKRLQDAQVKDVLSLVPEMGVKADVPLNYAVLEAIIQTTLPDDVKVGQDDILSAITSNAIKPELRSLTNSASQKHRKFAFIVHPLSIRDLFRHPLLSPIYQISKPAEKWFESGFSKLPGISYGKITGIKSESTGVTAEGIIYSLFSTPRQMVAMDPQAVYEKLIRLTERAAQEGCEIIGLGGFTKVVGDAGVTVANRSPIPVTTGNSLSAAATLWAARLACDKMGFLPAYKTGARIRGTAMVVGATGSIGAVSAKLLGRVVSRLILTGPRAEKLLALKDEIQKISADVEIVLATNSDRYAHECDLIVISTSSVDGNVMDLAKVKPGAVICDVSRPLSYKASHAMTRPDVLIIESGELLLPGDVHLSCDIGLEESVVYACLAETALLALEGRMENFTLSRNINFTKVSEIYDISKRHGAKLATIQGPVGIITDQEIALCREHALKALKGR